MMRTRSILTAVTAGLGLAAATTSAKAFVIAPAVAAAALAGGIFGGALLGGAVANSANQPYAYEPPAAVTTQGGVTINATTCYYRDRLVNPVTHSWVRERVCTTPQG